MRSWPLVLLLLCSPAHAADDPEFENPQRVTIVGYSGDAMEPFITRDGSILIFNNSNANPAETDLHWAERVDDFTFMYRGKINGANSPTLDGVGSVDRDGNLLFVTLRSYASDFMTIYRARFERGTATDVSPVDGVSLRVPGQLNFDAEISADGNTLYFVDGLFTGGAVPATADLAIAERGADGTFHRADAALLSAVNSSALEYAPSTSEDERELFFTRLEGLTASIWRSTRPDKNSRWSAPTRLSVFTGFVEAPTVAPGGNALYYHALRDGRYVIERVTRRVNQKRRAVRRG